MPVDMTVEDVSSLAYANELLHVLCTAADDSRAMGKYLVGWKEGGKWNVKPYEKAQLPLAEQHRDNLPELQQQPGVQPFYVPAPDDPILMPGLL